MGLRFDITSANWVAHLLQPGAAVPAMEESWKEAETLRIFLWKLRDRFYSTPFNEQNFRRIVERSDRMLQTIDEGKTELPAVLLEIRGFLARRPWTSLIVPSGRDPRLDDFLCNEDFLKFVVEIRPGDPGLILQLEVAPRQGFALLDVFPAFRTALAESNKWPGVLIWATDGDSVFLPFGTTSKEEIRERASV